MSEKEQTPFRLPWEICELIFANFSFSDLIQLQFVSTVWHDFIVFSNYFDKAALRIDHNTCVEDVLGSGRRFKSLRLVKVNNDEFLKSLRWLGSNATTIEISYCNAQESSERIKLRNLKELTLSNVSSNILHPLLNFHQNLRKLDLHNVKASGLEIVNLLELNENLRELNLYLDESSNIFQHDISSNCKFDLTSITISFKCSFEIDARTLTNVEKFLKRQGETLRTIDLINSSSLSLIHRVWNHMKAVERLHYFSGDPFLDIESERPQLALKPRLKSLEVHILGPNQLALADLQPILEASKNLVALGAWNVCSELIEYAASHLTTLENISCATLDDDCESFYEQLKSKSGINKKIKIHQYL